MPGAVDDFSTLVSIKTPDDLLQRPLYQERINITQSKLAEVLAPYRFSEPYPCGISGCRTLHQRGFLVRTEDARETNIGKDCGVTYFGQDFQIKAHLQEQRAVLKAQMDVLDGVRQRQPEMMRRIAELFNRPFGAKWAEATLRGFKEAVGHVVYRQVRDRASRSETLVEHSRETTPEERKRQQALHGKSKQYVTEKKGSFTGLELFKHHPGSLLTDIKDRLYALETFDARNATARSRREWMNWASELERSFDIVEECLANGVRFFCQENLTLLPYLATSERDKERLAQLRWSTAEHRVVS